MPGSPHPPAARVSAGGGCWGNTRSMHVAHTTQADPCTTPAPHLVAAALAHVLEVEPTLKVAQAAEDVGHQEVEQGPQLSQVVLQGGAWGQVQQGGVSRAAKPHAAHGNQAIASAGMKPYGRRHFTADKHGTARLAELAPTCEQQLVGRGDGAQLPDEPAVGVLQPVALVDHDVLVAQLGQELDVADHDLVGGADHREVRTHRLAWEGGGGGRAAGQKVCRGGAGEVVATCCCMLTAAPRPAASGENPVHKLPTGQVMGAARKWDGCSS